MVSLVEFPEVIHFSRKYVYHTPYDFYIYITPQSNNPLYSSIFSGNNETKTVWPTRPDPECAGKSCGEDCRVEKNGTLVFEGICKGHGYCFSPSCPSCPDLECKHGDKFGSF